MNKLDIQSEPFTPYGNMSADGIIKQLGSPTLQKTRVLIRETVQNSDDARHRGDAARLPSYRIHLRTLNEIQSAFLNQDEWTRTPALSLPY